MIRDVVDSGGVAWVVSDDANPAPPGIRSRWHLAYATATVAVYRRR